MVSPPQSPLLTKLQSLDEDAETMVRKVWRMLIFYRKARKGA